MKKMRAKKKNAWLMVVAVGLAAVLIRPVEIGGWGSTTPGFDTHQFIDQTAYACLETRFSHLPGFIASVLPTIDQILSQEGNTLESLGSEGNGPDVEGSSLYSQHWFNPRVPSNEAGEAPASVADLALRFIKSKRTDLQAAAWGAHFLADVSTPVHLNGVMREIIIRIYNNATTGGTNSLPVTLPHSITGFMGRSEPRRNWRTGIERFMVTPNDFLILGTGTVCSLLLIPHIQYGNGIIQHIGRPSAALFPPFGTTELRVSVILPLVFLSEQDN